MLLRLLLAAVLLASASSCVSPGAGTRFGVKASGNRFISIVDGSPVELIGTNMSGCETPPAARCEIIAAAPVRFWAKTFKSTHPGTNTVRLPINALFWLGNPAACGGGYGAPYQGNVRQAVARATAAGLYVILDLHWTAPNGYCAIGQPGYPDADHVFAFWKQIADIYGGQPNVIFELFNEPYGDADNTKCCTVNDQSQLMVAGGTEYQLVQQNNAANDVAVTTKIAYQVAGEAQMLATIRAAGANNLVLGGSYWWDGEIETWPALWNIAAGNPDPLKNFAAAMHAYGYDRGLANLSAVLDAGYPLVITEFIGPIGKLGNEAEVKAIGVNGLIAWGANAWHGRLDVSKTGW